MAGAWSPRQSSGPPVIEIGRPQWVMDEMKRGVLAERLARADAIVYLDLSTRACLAGVIRRRIRYRGQLRPDLGVYDQGATARVWWTKNYRTPTIRRCTG